MTIDWQKEVAKREDALLADLVSLLQVKSEREDELATADAPFGPGPKNALLHMLAYGERDGFAVKNVDNYAGHIEYGEGDETLGIFIHVDVVPAGDGWDTDPYEPVIKDGRIYARGTSDDKGPGVACYYGLKMIKELGLPVSKKIRFIVGTDEESGWADMDYYLEHEAKPDFGFSPDAEFPIINGEKGNVTFKLNFAGTNGGEYDLVNFNAGLRDNMVPGGAKATVTALNEQAATEMAAAYETFVSTQPITGTVTVSGQELTFDLVGKSAHGASPQDGISAGSYLAAFLNDFAFGGAAKNFVAAATKYIHEDCYGEAFGLARDDARMGKLTMNAGLYNFAADSEANFIGVNFRYPQGLTSDEIMAELGCILADYGVTVTKNPHDMAPHYVPADDPLVATLLQVYTDHTGQAGAEKVIGGGTFGRLLERGVAYGAQFPGWTDTMHQANEYMELNDIYRSAAIYADAIYRLAK